MVKLSLLPVFDTQVCPVVLGVVDLVGLVDVQLLLRLLGQVALKKELVEHSHGGLVQIDNLNINLVKKRQLQNVPYQTVLEAKDTLGVGQFLGELLEGVV